MAETVPLTAFMTTPLVQWVELIVGRELKDVEDLVDGVALSEIMLQIDPRPTNAKADKSARGNVNLMIQNLTILLKHIKAYYEDIQQQVVIMSLPNLLILAKEPYSVEAITELQKLLLLVLGCAVQCDYREHYIEKMKELTYQGMEVMMNHIKDITENNDNVFSLQWLEQEEHLPPAEMDELSRSMSYQIRKLASERDKYCMMITGLTQERDYLQSQQGSPNSSLSRKESFTSPATKQHLLVEVADLKARLRKTKQELDDKVEHSSDLKAEIEEKDTLLKKLRQESLDLANDARAARAYRDENDILKEKATKATKLENEVERLKEKLKDVDFYKQRVEELRDDNKVLHETKIIIEDQLEVAQTRLDELVDTEKKIIELKRQISSLHEEKDRDHQKIQELVEENMNLEMDKKQSMNESGNLAYQLEQAKGSSDGVRMSIQAESEESAQNKVLRLEKENRRLQSLINSYNVSMSSTQIAEANLLELEKENKRLGKKVQQLQDLLSKEKHSVLDYEQLSGDMMAEKRKLETMVETVKANTSRQIDELQNENEQLNRTVETLRKRSKISAEGKTKDIEKENLILNETVKDVTARMHQNEFEKKQLRKSLEQARDNIERAEELTKENAKLEKENISLQKTVAQLKITCEQVERLEQMNSDLDVENRQLKKQVDNLKNMTMQVQDLEKDKGFSDQEASKLRRQVESLRKTCEKMSQLEQEKLDAEKALKRMQRSMEAMKQSKEQTEKMEILQTELENELERVRSQLDVSQVSKEKEILELEKENEELQSRLDQHVASSKKHEHFEREFQKMEGDNVKLESLNKKLTKENQRAKQSVEKKAAKLEEATEELESMNRQNKAMMRQIEKMEESSNRIRELETEVRECKKQQSVEKKTLTTLREDLVNEKLLVQQKQNELDRLSGELESIGLNKEQLLNNQTDEKRFKALESRFDTTFKRTVEAKEEKILSLEARLGESANLNKKLRGDIKNIKREFEALAQRHNEEVDFGKSRSRSSRDYSATEELIKIKDHLIDVERKNATLIAENSSIQSVSQDLKEQVGKLRTQNEKIMSQHARLQDGNTALQTQCARLQVENSTLQSQTTSLLSQNANVTNQQGQVETEKHELLKQLEEAKHEKESLERDHDDLMQLHENQTVEVESLMQEHQKLKSQYKNGKMEFKELENKYNNLVKTKDDVERLRKRLQSEVERKSSEGMMVEENLDVMKEAHEKLNSSYKKLSQEYEELQSKNRSEKMAHNSLKLEFAKLEAEIENIKDQNQQLDFTTSKLSNRCDVLMQLKLNLEDENRHLLEQINRLMSQNEELLSQTLESKDQIYSEQKQYTERMQEIRRQKEKLEEKIMDLYRTPGPSPPKRRGFGATLKKTFQNLGKGSENRRRRDGLPPSSSSTSKLVTNSPRNETPYQPTKEVLAAKSSDRDSESVGSNSSENHRKNSAAPSYRRVRKNMKLFNQLRRLYPVQKRGSYTLDTGKEETKGRDTKRRSRLGGNMAYSTNAINAVVMPNNPEGRLDENYSKDFKSIEDMQAAIMASQSSLDHESVDSMGSEASSQQLRKSISQQDSASSLSGSVPKGRLSSASSEDPHAPGVKTPTSDRISLQQFLDENKGKSPQGTSFSRDPRSANRETQGSANRDNYRSEVTRPRSNTGRPSSMIDKPMGSVSPYSHLTSHTSSLRVNPRNDSGAATINRSGSALERLEGLVSSPRGSSTPKADPTKSNQLNGLTTTPKRSVTPNSNRPTLHSGYTTMSLPRPAKRTPRGGALTSTPNSSRQIDVAMVNPIQPGTPTRRDVPPDVVPSPIRMDVPPSTDSLRRQTGASPAANSQSNPGGRRPATPTKPKQEDTSQDSEKSTLWFEYGCV